MAIRNHTLDEKIILSAKQEFLQFGYQKASLHKIAEHAGLTTGALYTRYTGKDDLFCSLILNILSDIKEKSASVQNLYEDVMKHPDAETFLKAIRQESSFYLDVLFEHYEECLLFFCKSDGSSIDIMIKSMMQIKTKNTIEFLKTLSKNEDLDFSGVEMILSGQFQFYREILEKGYSKEKAVSCMKTVELFLESGWKALFQRILS